MGCAIRRNRTSSAQLHGHRQFLELELDSPNDIVVKSDGAVYFTDPIFGRQATYGVPRAPQLAHSSVNRVDPAGNELQRLNADLE